MRAIDRYRELDELSDAMVESGQVPERLADRPEIVASPVHAQIAGLLDEMLSIGESVDLGPVTTMMRACRRLLPGLLRDFAESDPTPAVEFLHQLGHRLLQLGTVEQLDPLQLPPE